MTTDERISNIIIRLKEYKKEHPELTLQKISDGTGISLSTVTRIFAEGSEEHKFRYDSIQPIAEYVLEESKDDKALAIYRYNEVYIKELEEQLVAEKEKYERKLEKERAQFHKSLDFLKNQVALKDDRITRLLTYLEKMEVMLEKVQTRFLSSLDK